MVVKDIRELFEISILERMPGITKTEQLNGFELLYIQQGNGSAKNGNNTCIIMGKYSFFNS